MQSEVSQPAGSAPPRPLAGLAAAGAALLLLCLASVVYNARALATVARAAHALAPLMVPLKVRDLTFQQAALRDPRLLPIYGTSELYCCAGGFNGPRFFWHEPTGFALYAAGVPVTGDLFFAETFAALGHALRGKRVVISDSPWFSSPLGVSAPEYDHTFSPEIALAFAFDSPIPLPLREAIARQMLAYPRSLQGHPLLDAAIADLARGTPASLAVYWLLDPVGRLAVWVDQLRGDAAALAYLRAHRGRLGPVVDTRRPPDWPALLRRARGVAQRLTANNPFGVLQKQWRLCADIVPSHRCRSALALWRQRRTNRNGGVYPYPAAWVRATLGSAEWTDLALELQVLRSLGARPFVYLIPMEGAYDDHTPLSWPARQVLYQRYAAVAAAAHVPFTTFSAYDQDPGFVDSFGHLDAPGWVVVDRVLDLFWHGRLSPRLRRELAAGGVGLSVSLGLVPGCSAGGRPTGHCGANSCPFCLTKSDNRRSCRPCRRTGR